MLGIPTHLAPRVSAWSMVRASHVAAVCSLVVAAVLLFLVHVADPSRHVVPALVALVPMVLMIGVHARVGSWRSAAAFLAIGGVSAWWFAGVVEREVGDVVAVASYLVSLAIVPLVLVGGAGPVASRVIAWSILGFAVGKVATSIGTASVDGVVQPGILAWVALGLVVGIMGLGTRTGRRLRRIQPELLRSAREEHVSAYRQGVEAEAAALLHDTVLNHLNAIAHAPHGPMDADLSRALDEDLAALEGRDWLATGTIPTRTGAVVVTGRLGSLADEHRDQGLDVVLSGDDTVVDRLEPDVRTALLRAVGQCLTNVRKHAGTDAAELSVFDDGATCTVMVVDDGAGFDERATGADRMGLRQSIRQRVERVGGAVQVWSSPGSGTSIMLSVPMLAPVTSLQAEANDGRDEAAS